RIRDRKLDACRGSGLPTGNEEAIVSARVTGPVAEHGRSLTRNIVHAVIGMGFYSACQFAVTILLAKFASSQILGDYFFALAVSTPIILFFGLELRGVFVADSQNDFTYGTYEALRRTSLMVAAVLLTGILIYEAARGARPAFVSFLAAIFAGKIVWAVGEMGWGVFNRRERLDLLGVATILRGVGLVVPYGVILPILHHRYPEQENILEWGAVAASGLVALNWLIAYLFFDERARRQRADLDETWSWEAIRRLGLRTLPMGLVVMTINLADSFPRIVIKHLGSAEALGYFGAIVTLTLLGNLVVVQASNAAANRISLLYRAPGPGFARLLLKLIGLALAVGLGMTIILVPFGEVVMRMLYRPEYAAYQAALQIVLLAQVIALLTAVFGVTVTQMRMFWMQVPAQVITLGTTAIAALLLIPGQPIRGAATTALVRALTQFVLYASCLLWGIIQRARWIPTVDHAVGSNGEDDPRENATTC
ncbi:MAG: lipopolysaccharide biosynthesis protein, partial [Phycisphaerae bacterium]